MVGVRMRMPAPCNAFCAASGPRIALTNDLPGFARRPDRVMALRAVGIVHAEDGSLRENIGAAEAARDAGRCLQSLWDGRDGFRPATGWRIRRASLPWRSTSGGQGSRARAGARRGRSARAGSLTQPVMPARPATRPSLSGSRGAKRSRPIRRRLWEIRGAVLPGNSSTAGKLFQAAPVFRAAWSAPVICARRLPDPASLSRGKHLHAS